jgi:hypothetical protein
VRGSLTAEVIAGAAGAAVELIKISSALANALETVQISLDTTNRPVLTITHGGTMTASVPGGPAIAVGAMVQVRAVWDASKGLVAFTLLSGAPVPGTLGALPTAPWTTGPMPYVLVGYGASLAAFNGTILSLQVGDQVV